MNWCSTCGKDTPEGVSTCAECKQWWADNPPPADDEE